MPCSAHVHVAASALSSHMSLSIDDRNEHIERGQMQSFAMFLEQWDTSDQNYKLKTS
jgi:hypothetical protein